MITFEFKRLRRVRVSDGAAVEQSESCFSQALITRDRYQHPGTNIQFAYDSMHFNGFMDSSSYSNI